MNRQAKSLPNLVKICFLVDVGLCVAFLLNWLLGEPFVKPTALLDLNAENSIPAWYSSVQFFIIFLLGSVYVLNRYRQGVKSVSLAVLPALFLMMSMDETVKIHEWLGEKSDALLPGGTRVGSTFQLTGIWMFVVGIPFLLLFLIWAYSVRKHVDNRRSLTMLVVGLCVMLSGALGFEILSNFVSGMWAVVELLCEEGLEMVGATIMLWSVYELARGTMPHVADTDTVFVPGLHQVHYPLEEPTPLPTTVIFPAIVEAAEAEAVRQSDGL